MALRELFGIFFVKLETLQTLIVAICSLRVYHIQGPI